VNRWRELSFEAKSAAALVAVVLLGVGGFVAAAGVVDLVEPNADAAEARTARTVTIDRTVVTQLREVQRAESSGVLGKQVELRTVTLPVVRKELVTVPGPPRTVVETRSGETRTSVVTSERVVTLERVVTTERTRTVVRPVTTTRVVTESVPLTQTLRSTETVRVTETSQPATVIVDHPVTVTVTVTVTVRKP
jgi:hypothetical protein